LVEVSAGRKIVKSNFGKENTINDNKKKAGYSVSKVGVVLDESHNACLEIPDR
jgi:hypothetical protein